ncbi:MAG: amidohydrolase family protein [Clostridia bacterium]|nr:amidohydrolase family protein [Clostridia bacterium]
MLKAIDMHTHINHGSAHDTQVNEVYTADFDELMKINRGTGIEMMFCSTFASVLSDEEVEQENEYLFNLAGTNDDLYQWVVIDPRNDRTFEQARGMLESEKCVGIKIHPSCHDYSLLDFGDKIFSFASEFGAIVLTHPTDNILTYADKYPEMTLIMAHLGGVEFVDAVEFAKHGNVYTDTSGIASSKNKMIEYAVNRIGSEKILFGTDTYSAAFQRGRIEFALISDEDKSNILRYNSERLFEKTLKNRK